MACCPPGQSHPAAGRYTTNAFCLSTAKLSTAHFGVKKTADCADNPGDMRFWGRCAEAQQTHSSTGDSVMNRPARLVIFAAAAIFGALSLGTWAAASRADDDEATAAPPPLPELTFFDGSGWVPLNRHAGWVSGAGATVAGTATATLKSKLDGPKTYVVIAGTTSETILADPKPRFRIASDRTGAFRLQLAQFEVTDENRATTIERTSRGTFFTKGVDLEVMKISEGLWEVRPTKSLQPGEYGLATSDTDP